MPTSSPQRRFCIVNVNGGEISIRLQANNALRAGAEFKLFCPGNPDPRETWKMAAGNTGQSEHLLATGPKDLNTYVLTWEILVCAFAPTINTGTIEIQVLQDGVSCPCTKPAQWQLEDVSRCSDNEQDSISGSLVLLAH